MIQEEANDARQLPQQQRCYFHPQAKATVLLFPSLHGERVDGTFAERVVVLVPLFYSKTMRGVAEKRATWSLQHGLCLPFLRVRDQYVRHYLEANLVSWPFFSDGCWQSLNFRESNTLRQSLCHRPSTLPVIASAAWIWIYNS